jgi:Zn-dependent protease
MLASRAGSVRLFSFLGIGVYLHWSWALVAVFQISGRRRFGDYDNSIWNALEYFGLFGIVILHEFGHALACRSVGGKAEDIVLWPLGGIARVAPPHRPGATLWSIAAGPLVNVALVPVTLAAYWLGRRLGVPGDIQTFLLAMVVINIALLVFNMLPIYPLDGGQIVRSLLWYVVGAGQSLLISAIVGACAAGAALLAALSSGNLWLAIMAVFVASISLGSIRMARAMRQMERAPTNPWARCPACQRHPPAGPWWLCPCGAPLDAFAGPGVCAYCGRQVDPVPCPHCHEATPRPLWQATPSPVPPPMPGGPG